MAFGAITQTASGGNETSQTSTTWAISVASTAAGLLAILLIAMDNLGTVDGETNQCLSVTDTKGNVWKKAGERTETSGAAGDGATVAVFYSVLTSGLTALSDTVTTTYSAAVVAKAMILLKSAIAANPAVVHATGVNSDSVVNADAAALSLAGLDYREYLFLRAIASETDTPTLSVNTSGYSTIGGLRASGSGGSEKGHVGIDGEHKIATTTGDTSDPTMTDTTADRASLLIAFCETNAGKFLSFFPLGR